MRLLFKESQQNLQGELGRKNWKINEDLLTENNNNMLCS